VRVHVVFAHPRSESFKVALYDCVLTTLRRAGHQVDDLDE
jgi:putative NADPH-quinone reductase